MAEAGWKLFVDGRVELGHFDAVEQRIYRLPEDSAPKVRGRGTNLTQQNTICLVLPTHNDLDYAAKAASSFMRTVSESHMLPMVCAVDDASDGVTDEQYADWARENGIQEFHRFPETGGMTRSWNYGVRVAHRIGAEYTVCGNADTVFSTGWVVGIVSALRDHDLAGPVTNASGWGTPRQNVKAYLPDYVPDDSTIEQVAALLASKPTISLTPAQLAFGPNGNGATLAMPEFLNGFCVVAKTSTWFAGAFDSQNVFDPSKINSENEVELEVRWMANRLRLALVPSSFVFHYRSVSRGDKFLCEGAFRPAATEVQA
jgi:GT2 family glycosyltransferase